MLLIDLYRTIIINLIFAGHISTRLGHPMTDTFYVFFSPPSSAQNIFPHFFLSTMSFRVLVSDLVLCFYFFDIVYKLWQFGFVS